MRSFRRRWLPVVALAAAALLGACGGVTPATSPSQDPVASLAPELPAEVSPAAAAAMQVDGAFLLDVREPSEWAAGHIAGATLIPLGQLPARLGEVPHDRSVVTVCRTGHRAAQARDILLGAGYTAVSTMTGGMTDWIAAGLPIATGL